jgi:DNA-binding MarR family transcriptional regulator
MSRSEGREARIQEALIRLDEAWSRLSRQVAADIKEYPISIPLSQAYLLRLLDQRGPLRMSEIATRLGVKLSGCTALVDRAVEAGWVVRERDPHDRRVVRVTVSPDGERILDELREIRARIFARYLICLEPAEIETLATLLSRAAEVIGERRVRQVT